MLRRELIWAYALLVGLPLIVLLVILKSGSSLTAPAAAALQSPTAGPSLAAPLNLIKLVLQIGVILLASRLTGMLFKTIGQPQVVGEMVAGILLGPSLLGWAAPAFSSMLFPAPSLHYLNALSQIGLILFMFGIGVALDPKELKEHGHAAILISHVSIVVPFCLGSALALLLYGSLSNSSISFSSFALFMGAAMSITAFPVLARILTERDLLRTRMGTLSISCAAVDDITGWCILAYIVVLIRSDKATHPVWVTVGGVIAYMLVMYFAVRPLMRRFEAHFQRTGRLTENSMSLMVALVLASALATEWLGIHLVFGAFLVGALMPKDPEFVQVLRHKVESIAVVVLLPLFFAYSGLRTNITVVHGRMWLFVLLVVAAAIAGKFGGSMFAARMAGIRWRDAASLGDLMNTRGLMELIALNIGLDIGVISPTVFTIMVLMALVTTFMTSPLLEWVYPCRLTVVEADHASAHVA
jgi:Kef-type K+ transport system membrane component KefB